MSYLDNFEQYIRLYESGTSLSKLSLPTKDQSTLDTFQVFKSSKVDVRIIDRDKNLDLILGLVSISNFVKDTANYSHRFFYMVPLQTPKGTIVGFILRTVFGKLYHTVSRNFSDSSKQVPIMFGWYKDFLNYNSKYPIVVCEGAKDCITLKKIYPYVLSNNTSSLGLNLEIVKPLTKYFVLIYDNDETGLPSMTRDRRNIFYNSDCIVSTMHTPDGYKDTAELFRKDLPAFKSFGRKLLNNIKNIDNPLII